ncbi:NlpC/P60 family protein [Cytophagaceae bacterium ABcell3]|nr:NlpC/P60 family protein [Cytophagaceae bacterium ABcell3]
MGFSSADSNKPTKYGICHLSVVSVRKEPSDKSEITTQLLFGDGFVILDASKDGKWLYIHIAWDNYTGWIDAKQFKVISEDFFKILHSMQWPFCKDLVGLLHGAHRVTPVLYGSSLPVLNNNITSIETEAFRFQGDVNYPIKVANFQYMKTVACYYLSAPYLWGGKTHFGIDCSGFIQQVSRICGIKMPRDAWQQAKEGQVVFPGSAKPGDYAFFADEHGEVIHVGIILEHDKIIHASGEVRVDFVDSKGISLKRGKNYTHLLHSIKRVLPD